MKILVLTGIINEYSAAKVSLRLAQQFKRRGHDVLVIGEGVNFSKDTARKLEKEGIRIETLDNMSGSRVRAYLAALKMLKSIRKYRADIIYANCDFAPYVVARLFGGAPIVATFNHLQLVWHNLREELLLGYRSISVFEKLQCLLADLYILAISFLEFATSSAVVAGSEFSRQEVRRLGARNIAVSYWGVDLFDIRSDEIVGKKNGEIWILSVSRIVPYKSFHKLIGVFAELRGRYPNLRLFIVGNHPKNSYYKYLRSLSGEVTFLSELSAGELHYMYENCDIYATASNKEGFGLTVIEAGLHKKPSVAFRNSALPEVVLHEKTGFLASSRSEYKKYLGKLVADKKLRERMGDEALKHARSFTWEKCAREYEKIFKEQINS